MEGGAKNRFLTLIYMATSLNTMEVYYNDFTTEKTLLMTALQSAVKRRALCNCFSLEWCQGLLALLWQ